MRFINFGFSLWFGSSLWFFTLVVQFHGVPLSPWTEEVERRQNELVNHRLRVAGFGKLCVTILAGGLAGIVLWAMTTATANLTKVGGWCRLNTA